MNTKTLLIISVLALGLLPLGLSTQADNAMSGMDMSPNLKSASLSVTAAVNPTAPRMGDNTLVLTILDAAGKPVTGLPLTTSVAMMSMDMGTTHPTVTETGNGHYVTKVTFSMNGPWRVIVRTQRNKVAVFDFAAGTKTPWKSPPITAVLGTVDASAAKAMPDMNMAAAKMEKMTGIADMKTATMPELQEKGTYTVAGNENWVKQTGFGHNAGMVGMMNQMMVGGSGMEGMKMPAMKMEFGEQNYTQGEDDAGAGDMAGMDMIKEKSKPDSMAGMNMDGKASAVKPTTPVDSGKSMPPVSTAAPIPTNSTPAASSPLKITATMASLPKAGDNSLLISITDAQGKPVRGATITTSVAMTSMDMGTTHPAVTETGVGKYTAKVNFSMAGPWRVKVKVVPPGQKPLAKSFDFTAK